LKIFCEKKKKEKRRKKKKKKQEKKQTKNMAESKVVETKNRHAVPEKRHVLNVPCIAWIYSQAPKLPVIDGKEATNGLVAQELKAPIIIWWIESVLPSNKKRKLYFSYLDERGAPMRGNLSVAIKHKNEEFKSSGFNINCTNTYRYVYAVPKILNASSPFAGYNLWANYQKISYVPSYIADHDRLVEQNLALPTEEEANELGSGEPGLTALNGVILTAAKGSKDEQALYRNMVITTCNPVVVNPTVEESFDPTCQTSAVDELLEHKELNVIAQELLWKLDIFLQYVADNTFLNFQRAGYGSRLMEMAYRELRLVEFILFQEKNYRVISRGDSVNNANVGALASPPLREGDERSRRPIQGVRLPTIEFPWT
jgi:hypothetical protein